MILETEEDQYAERLLLRLIGAIDIKFIDKGKCGV